MIVVSDTSPLTSLLQIGRLELLSTLYSEIFIPEAVQNELLKGHPSIPGFVRVQSAQNRDEVARIAADLDPGEAEAIIPAKELKADELLIDETAGRRIAQREGVHVIGLHGVLLEAKKRGLISSGRQIVKELERDAGFRLSNPVKELFYREAGEP